MKDSALLAERAAHFRKLVLDVAYGPGGMIVDFPRYDTRRPWQEGGKYSDWWMHWSGSGGWGPLSPQPTEAEAWYGENTLWVTGLLLLSQILRYRVTKEEEARQTARKCYLDLNNYFRLSAMIEPGVLGKPHGGRPGGTWSFDQSSIPVIPYAQYALELATPEEKAKATENLAAHGDMYIRRDFKTNFFGNEVDNNGGTFPSLMKLIACIYAAYDITGNSKYRDFAFRHLQPIMEKGLPWPVESYGVNHNMWYWGILCDYWNHSEFKNKFDWKHCISEYWKAVQTAFGEDYLALNGIYNNVSEVFTPVFHGWLSLEEARNAGVETWKDSKRVWSSPTCFYGRPAESITFVLMGLLARSYGFDVNIELLKKTLLALDEERMCWCWDDGDMPEEYKAVNNVFSTETPAIWLMAYWEGRRQGVW